MGRVHFFGGSPPPKALPRFGFPLRPSAAPAATELGRYELLVDKWCIDVL